VNPHIQLALRQFVIRRALNRCEYCQLSQVGQEAAFHIDHIVPVTAGGPTLEENLALACVSCSLRKGARVAAVDPETGQSAPIYHPRRQLWDEHFYWEGAQLVGITDIGRATIMALRLNRLSIVSIRIEEMAFGRHPPE
jgi:hypothetical protein